MNSRGYDIRERMANRFEVDHRAALFGSRMGNWGGAARGGDASRSAAYARDVLEQQNDAQIEDLEAKVSELKGITQGIGREVSESTKFLEGMGVDFDKAQAMLKGTLGNLKVMMNNRSGKHMWYMVAFMVFLFLLMYLLKKSGAASSGGASVG